MLTTFTRLKVVAFVLISLVVLTFIGLKYANLGPIIGLRGYYVVSVDLAGSGGIFTNADVTYRGVTVGRVGPLTLTDDGVRVTLHVDNSAPRIPANTDAVVTNLSAVGEQYVDLRPKVAYGPYLHDGSAIAEARTSTPRPVQDVLAGIDQLAASVPKDSLRTVVDELYDGFSGQGPNLQVLLDTSGSFIDAAAENTPATTALIVDSRTVLQTQAQQSDAIISFGRDARLLAAQLAKSDPDLRRIIAIAPAAAGQVSGLLADLDPGLSALMANLLTTSNVAYTRDKALKQLLGTIPAAVAIGHTVMGDGLRLGNTTTFFNPLPCVAGYGGTTYRNGLDTRPQNPLNTRAKCTLPASSGVQVRGSANAPYGGGVPPAVPVPRATPLAVAPGDQSSTQPASMAGLLGLTP